jgi:hypothetical protein
MRFCGDFVRPIPVGPWYTHNRVETKNHELFFLFLNELSPARTWRQRGKNVHGGFSRIFPHPFGSLQ